MLGMEEYFFFHWRINWFCSAVICWHVPNLEIKFLIFLRWQFLGLIVSCESKDTEMRSSFSVCIITFSLCSGKCWDRLLSDYERRSEKLWFLFHYALITNGRGRNKNLHWNDETSFFCYISILNQNVLQKYV